MENHFKSQIESFTLENLRGLKRNTPEAEIERHEILNSRIDELEKERMQTIYEVKKISNSNTLFRTIKSRFPNKHKIVSRLIAQLIDGTIICLTSTLAIGILKLIGISQSMESFVFTWLLFGIAAELYYVVLPFKYGATVGKQVLGIRITSLNDSSGITMRQSANRQIFQIIPILFPSLLLLDNSKQTLILVALIIAIGSIWHYVDVIVGAIRNDHRCVHDLFAGTICTYNSN